MHCFLICSNGLRSSVLHSKLLSPNHKLNKIGLNFIWHDDIDNTSGGLVNWPMVCRPKPLGPLGLAGLKKFGRALRMRWPWFQWTDPERPWVHSTLPCDDSDMDFFRASTTITTGNGAKTLF